MLNFFFTRHSLPTIQTLNATPFNLLSAAEFENKIIPLSHIYISPESYLTVIKESLGEQQAHIIQVSEQQTKKLITQKTFPLNMSNYQIDTLQELLDILNNNQMINIAIFNGIGLGFGDNFVGLGVIQRIAKLLSPRRVHFHLMQTMNQQIAPVYSDAMHANNMAVSLKNNCISVEEFLQMDAYVDLTGMLNYKEFGEMPLARFFATAFSVENLIHESNQHPHLYIHPFDVTQCLVQIKQRFSEEKPLVLYHHEASSKLRSCPIDKSKSLIDAITAQGYNVITAYPFKHDNANFQDCSDLSQSIIDLKHVIAACDVVISVGTVTYHLSSALGKPTILLPIIKADIRTAAKSPEVLCWLPKESKQLYLDKFKSKQVSDLLLAQQIWKNVNEKHLAEAIKPHLNRFNYNQNQMTHILSHPKIAVIISDFGNNNDLISCIQSLTKNQLFDALWMQVIDCQDDCEMNSISLNNAIEKAIQDNCKYIWVLSSNQQASPDYLEKVIHRFSIEPKTAMIAGRQLDLEEPNTILWAGSISAFPYAKVNTGSVTEHKFSLPSNEDWVPFESVVIRTEALLDIGFLDEAMRTHYFDIDFCYRTKQHHWQIRYEPCAVTKKRQLNVKPTLKTKSNTKQDFIEFYNKWSKITQCVNINELNEAILAQF